MTRVPLCVDSSDGISFRDNGLPHPLDGGAAVRPRHLKQGIEGVDTVHTLAVGLGRTTAGLGRTGDVFGGVASIQRLEPGSSPTSGTCFPCSGAFEPLSVHNFSLMGPAGPIFVGGRCCGRWLLLCGRRFGPCSQSMGACGLNYMTLDFEAMP